MHVDPPSTVAATASSLSDLGFQVSGAPARFRRGRATAVVRDGWFALEVATARVPGDPLQRNLAVRGPWRWRPTGSSPPWRRSFELPLGVVSGIVPSGPGPAAGDPFRAAAAWALATSSNRTPPGWSAPRLDRVREAIPDRALVLRRGGLVRQGRIVHEPRRLAFRFPVCDGSGQELPSCRKRWLRWLLTDAQARWRWVRIGVARDGAAHLEIDLTGMPHEWTEPLAESALDALRSVLGWLLDSADFLAADTTVVHALEIRPWRDHPRDERRTR